MSNIVPFSFLPGIQRDGPPLKDKACQDGQWFRFVNGVPRTIDGYSALLKPSCKIITVDAKAKNVPIPEEIEQTVIFDRDIPGSIFQGVISKTIYEGEFSAFNGNEVRSNLNCKVLFAVDKDVTVTITGKLYSAPSGGAVVETVNVAAGVETVSSNSYNLISKIVVTGLQGTDRFKIKTVDPYFALESYPGSVALPFLSAINFIFSLPVVGMLVIDGLGAYDVEQSERIVLNGETAINSLQMFKRIKNISMTGKPTEGTTATVSLRECLLYSDATTVCSPPACIMVESSANMSVKIEGYYNGEVTETLSTVSGTAKTSEFYGQLTKIQLADSFVSPDKARLIVRSFDYLLLDNYDFGVNCTLQIDLSNTYGLNLDFIFVGKRISGEEKEKRFTIPAGEVQKVLDEKFLGGTLTLLGAITSPLKLKISTDDGVFLTDYYLSPSSKLVFKKNDVLDNNVKGVKITGNNEKGERLVDKTYLFSDRSKILETTDYFSKTESVFLLSDVESGDGSEITVETSTRAAQGGFRLKPLASKMTASTRIGSGVTTPKWHLVTGLEINGKEEGEPYSYSVQNQILDGENWDVEIAHQPILSGLTDSLKIFNQEYYKWFFSDLEEVNWVFDFFASNNKTYLLALQTNNMTRIEGNNIPTPVLFVDLEGSLKNDRLLPISKNTGIKTKSFSDNPEDYIYASGGVLVLYPYIFFYNYAKYAQEDSGNKTRLAENIIGSVAHTFPNAEIRDGEFIQNITTVASNNIVYAAPIRGGDRAPSGLLWALDSVIKVSNTGDPKTPFRYDIISSSCSILSANCVIEDNGLFYWIGVDCFYVYNGTVAVFENTFNLKTFFSNLDTAKREKTWGVFNSRFNEYWWFYCNKNLPGYEGECNACIVYNKSDKVFYDTPFPVSELEDKDYRPLEGGQPTVSSGRGCGSFMPTFIYPVWYSNNKIPLPFIDEGVEDKYSSLYLPFLHDKVHDMVIRPQEKSSVVAEESLLAPRLCPIYRYLRSQTINSLSYGGSNGLTKLELSGLEFNFDGSGNLYLDVAQSSYINQPFAVNTLKAKEGQSATPYLVYVPSEVAIAEPQRLVGEEGEVVLTPGAKGELQGLSQYFQADIVPVIYWQDYSKADEEEGNKIEFKLEGKYAETAGSTSQGLAVSASVYLEKNTTIVSKVFRTVSRVSFKCSKADRQPFVSIGYAFPSQELIEKTVTDLSQAERKNKYDQKIISDQARNYRLEFNESNQYLSFILKHYGLFGYCEVGPMYMSLKADGIGSK